MSTWAVLSGTRGTGKLIHLEESDQRECTISDQVSHEADRSLCHTQLCWDREGILGESVAAEPCVAWRRESEEPYALRYRAQERSEEVGGRGVRGQKG